MNVPSKRGYKNGARATRDDFIDDAKVDGSLWTSDGQTNYFLTKNRIRTVGDIISVTASDDFVRDVAFELKRSLTPDEREAELDLAQERLRRKAYGLPEDDKGDKVASSAASASRKPAADGSTEEPKEVEVPKATFADVDLRKSMDFKTGDQSMAEVVERYPNGNYKIRGVKKIRYRNGYRMINFVAIAKNSDIGEDDKIDAGKLYEYRIETAR
jgi:flagellar basal body L-ring protein FlgH